MKVLQIINSLGTAGAERLVTDMTRKMNKEGICQVDLLVLNGAEKSFIRELTDDGVSVFILGGKNYEYCPVALLKIASYIKKYDLIHVHLFPSQYWTALARFLVKSRARFVTTEHSTYNTRCRFKLTTWMDRKMYHAYDVVVGISEATSNYLRKRIGTDVPIVTIENGVDLKRFKILSVDRKKILPQLCKDCFVVMQVARFEEAKNQTCVIRALTHLPQNVCLVLVGDGSMLETCKSFACRIGVSDRVFFMGKRSDVPELLTIADVVVMSSKWEGFGLSAVEAMAASKPVIASDVDGLKQIVDGYGLIFEENNDEQLAHLILKLINHVSYRLQIAVNCKKRSEHYDIENQVKAYFNLYKILLK